MSPLPLPQRGAAPVCALSWQRWVAAPPPPGCPLAAHLISGCVAPAARPGLARAGRCRYIRLAAHTPPLCWAGALLAMPIPSTAAATACAMLALVLSAEESTWLRTARNPLQAERAQQRRSVSSRQTKEGTRQASAPPSVTPSAKPSTAAALTCAAALPPACLSRAAPPATLPAPHRASSGTRAAALLCLRRIRRAAAAAAAALGLPLPHPPPPHPQADPAAAPGCRRCPCGWQAPAAAALLLALLPPPSSPGAASHGRPPPAAPVPGGRGRAAGPARAGQTAAAARCRRRRRRSPAACAACRGRRSSCFRRCLAGAVRSRTAAAAAAAPPRSAAAAAPPPAWCGRRGRAARTGSTAAGCCKGPKDAQWQQRGKAW